MAKLKKVVAHLKDYCINSTMAGVAHIANSQLHFTERVFWLICVTLSALGSYQLIRDYNRDFESKAVSIAYEPLRPHAKSHFPSMCICPSRKTTDSVPYMPLEDYVNKLGEENNQTEYNFDVELYLTLLIYPQGYHYNSLISKCKPYMDRKDSTKCPESNYQEIAKMLFNKCESFFVRCSWYGKSFDCCKYFRPLQTSIGNCFIMNSLHNNKPGSPHWFNSAIENRLGNTVLQIETSTGLYSNFLDAEGLPSSALSALHENILEKGSHREVYIYKTDMVNDVDIREISPEARKCRFPDEVLPNSIYEYYSFSGCITDCLRRKHLKLCNCSLYLLVVRENDNTPVCNLTGNMCLDSHDMILATTSQIQPNSKDFECSCLPSCNEADIRIVYTGAVEALPNKSRMLTVKIMNEPEYNYRRQAVRTHLDVVVTIGGILGLFMGVSILSGLEVIYFFTVRLFSNAIILKK